MEKLIFEVLDVKPFVKKYKVQFGAISGNSRSAVQKRVHKLYDVYSRANDRKVKVLEVSSASDMPLGVSASAFNLRDSSGKTVECIFQASKKFAKGGPYLEILDMSSVQAKKYQLLKTSGQLVAFVKEGKDYPLNPTTAFYNWIYINALMNNTNIAKQIQEYEAFSDIWFNHTYGLNCQAEACAIYCGLAKSGQLEEAMKSFEDFVKVVY